ncbi:MAG: hypothetical protein WC847_01715 [Candidatus Paceibacterota bacterium]|jgi:hypothetical protein
MEIIERSNERLVWSALEYEEKDRSQDWFWALGIIVVTSSIASIIFENYFFAALLLLSGVLLGFFAMKKPEMVTYELNETGFKIHDRVYPYENIKSFYVQLDNTNEVNNPAYLKPLFFIHTERAFMPIISIPINETLAGDIHSVMTSKNIKEEEMKEHASEKIMEVLGF